VTTAARIAVLGIVAAGALRCQGDTPPSGSARVRSGMRNVIDAQQTFLAQHGHFAHSLAELDSGAVGSVGARFSLLDPADSTFRLVGTSTFGRTVRCEIRVTPANLDLPDIPCAYARD
jgi:hypothetical protein